MLMKMKMKLDLGTKEFYLGRQYVKGRLISTVRHLIDGSALSYISLPQLLKKRPYKAQPLSWFQVNPRGCFVVASVSGSVS